MSNDGDEPVKRPRTLINQFVVNEHSINVNGNIPSQTKSQAETSFGELSIDNATINWQSLLDNESVMSNDGPSELVRLEPNQTAAYYSYELQDIFSEDNIKTWALLVEKLNYMWTKIGLPNRIGEDRLALLQKKLIRTFGQFVNQEKDNYTFYLKRIKNLKSKIVSLLREMANYIKEDELREAMLTDDNNNWTQIDYELEQTTYETRECFLAQITRLDRIYNNLVDTKNEHSRTVVQLKSHLISILDQLGLNNRMHLENEQQIILNKKYLTASEFDIIKSLIQFYETMLSERKITCQNLAMKISKISHLITTEIEDYHLLLSFDKESNTFEKENYLTNQFVFSEQNQTKLIRMYDKLSTNLNSTWTKITEVCKQLHQIYELFEVIDNQDKHPLYERIVNLVESTTNYYGDNKESALIHSLPLDNNQCFSLTSVLEQFQLELLQYQALKSERINEIIDHIRRQYFQLLSKCLVDGQLIQENNRFNFLFLQEPHNDDTLQIHETEMAKLKQYFDKYETILNYIAKWRQLKLDLQECKQQLQNSYKNRGGIINQQLKKQRMCQNRFDQTEKQIEKWLENSFTQLDSSIDMIPFNLYGVHIEDIVNELTQSKQTQLTK